MSVIHPNRTHDLILQSDASASPTTKVELTLARDGQTGLPIWREARRPAFPPRQSQGAVSYAHKDPGTDLVYSQKDWSGGALQALYDPLHPNKYSAASGMDPRWEGVVATGLEMSGPMDFLARNLGAEDASVNPWTDVSTTVTRTTSVKRSGSASWSMVVNDVADEGYIALVNPTVYRSREITWGGYLRGDGSGSATFRLTIADSGGETNSTTTVAGTVTAQTYVSVTHTVAAAATYVRLTWDLSGIGAGSTTGYFDDGFVFPTGGVQCVGVAEVGNALYAAFGRCICQWDETNDVWNAVYVHASAVVTSLVTFGSNVFAAFGLSAAYVYGSSTTWTARTTGETSVQYLSVSRNVVWANDTANTVKSCTDPTEPGAAWSSAYTIGQSDTVITGLYDFNDAILVGKEDGLHAYLRVYNDGTSADVFLNLTNEWRSLPDPENFSRGQEWHSWLYLTAAQQSLYRFDGNRFQDISSLFINPRSGSFGGRVRATAADPTQLWLLVDTPTTDTTITKTTWLMSLRETSVGLLLHTMEEVSIGDINRLSVNRSSGTGYLWALGRLYNSNLADYLAAIYRWQLPAKTPAPAFDASPPSHASSHTHYLEQPVWDGDLPDDQKAFIALTIFTKPSTLDAEHIIVAKFKLDGAADWTTLGTYTGTGAIQTKFFDSITTPLTNAVGRSCQLRFEMTQDDTVSPQLYAFALHATLRPTRVKTWECELLLGSNVVLHNGSLDPESKQTKLSALSTLETQVYPIALIEDLDSDGTSTTTRVQIVQGTLERVAEDERHDGTERWRLVLQEVALA